MQTKLFVPAIFDSNSPEAVANKSVNPLKTFCRRLRVWLIGTGKLVQGWQVTRRQRKALYRLSDHLLRDIGISRYEALKEAEKPFWR